jgi:hypothetical protein
LGHLSGFKLLNLSWEIHFRINKEKRMKLISQLIKIFILFLALPLEISNASKRRAYLRIKKIMIATNFF